MRYSTAFTLLRRAIGIAPLVAGALMYASGVSAHHSFSAIFDSKDPVSITGTVTKVTWVNPHASFALDAKKADGTVESWEFQLHSPNSMMRAGWNRDTIKPGDVLTVKGARARTKANLAFVEVAVRPDGREVFKLEYKSEE